MSFLNRFQSSLESLSSLSENSKYVVAYSGGVDSHVLLYCCAKLKLPVRAVHVHHGLQSIADEWAIHCQNICEQLDICLDVVNVDAKKLNGQSPEETARNVRYDALCTNLQTGDCLITAQHQNDQAETLLLQLFRTSGVAGLSAMPERKQIGGYDHVRPLLSFTRREIETFANDNGLQWVEDPSNQDVRFDRNFIRENVIPLLQDRWSEISKQLSTVADLQASSLRVLEDMAAIDLANAVRTPAYKSKLCAYDVVSVLSMSELSGLSTERLYNLLRYWILTVLKISPTRNLLVEIKKTIINAQQDANSVIAYSGYEFRKYQDQLYLLKLNIDLDYKEDLIWNAESPLKIPALKVQLSSVKSTDGGLSVDLLNKSLKVCFRKGGESFQPEHRQHSQSLKKLLQEEGIPPWERNSFPLLYSGDELIAVVGLWVSRQSVVVKDQEAWLIDVEKL